MKAAHALMLHLICMGKKLKYLRKTSFINLLLEVLIVYY